MLDESKRRTAAGIIRDAAELLRRGYKVRDDGKVIHAAHPGDGSARAMEIMALRELAAALEAEPEPIDLEALKRECRYHEDPASADFEVDDSVDALIAYKDALEEVVSARYESDVLDLLAELRREA